MKLENHSKLGLGIYTATEIAQILRLAKRTIRRRMMKYWDGKLGEKYGSRYSWNENGSRAVSFHTSIEFYVMMRFSEAGLYHNH